MTFPTKLIRLQIGGSLYTQESWSVGFHFTTANAPPTAEGLSTAVEAFYDSLASIGRHNTAKLGFIKFNELDHITGKYANPNLVDAKYYVPEHTSAGTPSLLPQGTTCVTLTTALQRGRGHAGRIYLPGYGTVGATGHLDPTACVQIADKVAIFLNACIAFNPDLTPVVWSKIGDSVTPITGVKVGDIVDTQRRRRSSLPEVYHPTLTAISG